MIITIDFDNGEVVPDDLVTQYIQEKLEVGEDFTIGSVLLLYALRVEVKTGRYREDFFVEGIKGSVVIIEYKDELY